MLNAVQPIILSFGAAFTALNLDFGDVWGVDWREKDSGKEKAGTRREKDFDP